MNITVILYWENKLDRDYNTFMDSWFHMENFPYEEKELYFPHIRHVLETYQNTYHVKTPNYKLNDLYKKILPNDIQVLVNGVHYSEYARQSKEFSNANEIHLEILDTIEKYIDAKNDQINEWKALKEAESNQAIKEKEISLLKTLFEKYGPNAIDI